MPETNSAASILLEAAFLFAGLPIFHLEGAEGLKVLATGHS
jgi:hypothetical protein